MSPYKGGLGLRPEGQVPPPAGTGGVATAQAQAADTAQTKTKGYQAMTPTRIQRKRT